MAVVVINNTHARMYTPPPRTHTRTYTHHNGLQNGSFRKDDEKWPVLHISVSFDYVCGVMRQTVNGSGCDK